MATTNAIATLCRYVLDPTVDSKQPEARLRTILEHCFTHPWIDDELVNSILHNIQGDCRLDLGLDEPA